MSWLSVPVRRDMASMKALPKRKGNSGRFARHRGGGGLNESPSEKEGKRKTCNPIGTHAILPQ